MVVTGAQGNPLSLLFRTGKTWERLRRCERHGHCAGFGHREDGGSAYNGATGTALVTPEFAKEAVPPPATPPHSRPGNLPGIHYVYTRISGLRIGAVVLLDASGSLLERQIFQGWARRIRRSCARQPDSTCRVFQKTGPSQPNIPAAAAFLMQPASLALDGAGNLYIAIAPTTRSERYASVQERHDHRSYLQCRGDILTIAERERGLHRRWRPCIVCKGNLKCS